MFAPASPTAAHPSLPDASSAIAASATVAPVDVTMASVDLAAGQTTDAPAAVASAVVDPAAAPAVVVTPADAAPTAAAPAAAVPAPRFSCKDPLERRAGIPLGVIPSGDLVYSADTIVDDASKYYAITRGRFIGVFAKRCARPCPMWAASDVAAVLNMSVLLAASRGPSHGAPTRSARRWTGSTRAALWVCARSLADW